MFQASIIGNLGGDPEQRYLPSGQATLRFNVAVNQRVKADGEWQDKTEWVRVTVFGNRAETLANYLKKGTRVYVHGRLEARPWTSQQGELRDGLEVVADTVEFMSSRQQDDNGEASNWKPIQAPARASKPADDDDLLSLPF